MSDFPVCLSALHVLSPFQDLLVSLSFPLSKVFRQIPFLHFSGASFFFSFCCCCHDPNLDPDRNPDPTMTGTSHFNLFVLLYCSTELKKRLLLMSRLCVQAFVEDENSRTSARSEPPWQRNNLCTNSTSE